MLRSVNKKIILAFSLLAGVFFALHPVLAQSLTLEDVGATLNLGTADLKETIINIIRWFLGILGLLAVIYMIYGGFLWLTAAGKEAQIEKAKQTILQAAIGLVIILLSWAIVSFVVRTTTNVTNNGGSGPICDPADFCCNFPLDPSCHPPGKTFDITGITTCAARPDYAKKVPLSSAVSITFNTNLKTSTVQTAVEDTDPIIPNLEIKKCTDGTCSAFAPEPVQWPSAPDPVPAGTDKYGKIRPAVFSGGAPVGAAGNTIAEWVTKSNTITFYHKSFSTDENSPDNLYFEPNTTYRLFIPKKGAGTELQDETDRFLEYCRKRAPSTPIEGESIVGENCTVDDINGVIHWTFTTGADGAGPPVDVASTVPTSKYLAGVGQPDRNVPRSAAVAVDFNGAIDPNSVSTDNFRIFKCTTPPNVITGQGCVFDPANPLPPTDFAIIYSPTGATIQLANGKLFDAFTWYRAEVKDVYNLCGTIQLTNPFDWVFETNATVPGVEQVYPQNGFAFACPATEVFIQYKTSMWRVDSGSTQCDTGLAGTYVTDGAMSPPSGRALHVEDDHDPMNPNGTCTTYAFTPTSIGLQPGTTYHLGVNSDLTIDINGTKLNYGDTPSPANSPSQGPWSFTVAAPDKCVQPPVIKKISPSQGTNGQCVSVLGNYFDPQGNNAQEAGDKLELATENQDPNDAWTQKTIVTRVKAGSLALDQDHNFKVTVDYPAPIGPVSSTPKPWRLNSGSPSQGPCLFNVTPTSGPAGTQVKASGKFFGSLGGLSAVRFTGPGNNWDISSATWTDTTVDPAIVTVASGLGEGDVQVIDSAGNESNAVVFDVTPPPPGAGPKVEESTACDAQAGILPSPNPKKNEPQACINSAPSARFVSDMDVGTLTAGPAGNIALDECDSTYTICNPVAMAAPAITPAIRSFILHPAGNLNSDSYYRVTISTSVTTAAVPPVGFAAPYVWRFKTKAGNTECPVTNVVTSPCNMTFSTNFSHQMTAVQTNGCNILNNPGATYAWTNSEPKVCALIVGNTASSDICTGPADPTFSGSTLVRAATEGKTSNACKITHDPTFCNANADCTKNKFGELCDSGTPLPMSADDSICLNNKCTPVINSLTPPDGKIGTWVTANGCWFGTYVSGTSKMVFTSGKDGLPPNPLICGAPNSTWTNEWVVREVPDAATTPSPADATDGTVQVVRGDGHIATSTSIFDVNTVDHPKLCKLNKTSGLPGATVNLEGQDFGATRDNLPQDNVRFTHKTLATIADSPNPSPWTDKLITADVPVPTNFGAHNVAVFNNNVASNNLSFTILDPSAVGPGADCLPGDKLCVFPNDATCTDPGTACGYHNCCKPRPKIIPALYKPAQGATNVCRNTMVQAAFDQQLDGGTVSTTTVHYVDNSVLVNGKVSLQNTALNTGIISYQPGLLSSTRPQELQFTAASPTPVAINNPSFETAVGGVPTGWFSSSAVQSTDVPPGHSGFSGFGDCSGCSGNTQAYFSQSVPGSATVGAIYRLTGWIKVEQPAGTQSGLIARCSGGNPCGYDLYNDAPGLFDGGSGGWKFIDVTTKEIQTPAEAMVITCFARAGAKIWCDDITVTKLSMVPSAIRGKSGALADLANSPLNFTTGGNICTLDRVVVTANGAQSHTFYQPNQTYLYTAEAWSAGSSAPLSQTAAYTWKWSWLTGDGAVASVTNTTPNDSISNETVTSIASGTTYAEATAQVTFNSLKAGDTTKRSGRAGIVVDICDNPASYSDPAFDFTMSYCRGNGAANLLPNLFTYVATATSVDPAPIKSYFFKESNTARDAIGMLIFDNPEFLSPFDWYSQRFPLDTGGSSTTVSGYPALKTGTTTYVGVAKSSGGNLTGGGMMVVLDYNSNSAQASTKSVYNKLISKLLFNMSMPSDDVVKVVRDTKRRQDLSGIGLLAESYKNKNGSYPNLAAGSYIVGMSTSAWPSWQITLGNSLGRALPQDPLNDLTPACSAPYEAATCWAESTKTFQCPPDSHIYLYKSTGASYEVFGRMEYAFANGNYNPCSGSSSCPCFNYRYP